MRCDLLILGQSPEAWTLADEAAREGLRTIVVRPALGSRENIVPAVCAAFDREIPGFLKQNIHRRTISPRRLGPRQFGRAALAVFEKGIARRCEEWGIECLRGQPRFTSETTVEVTQGGLVSEVEALLIVVAVGTGPRQPAGFPSGMSELILPEQLTEQTQTPERLVVLGGGRTATAFSRLYAAAGSRVTQIASRQLSSAETSGPTSFRSPTSDPRSPIPDPRGLSPISTHDLWHDQVAAFRRTRGQLMIELASGRTLPADAVVLATGRQAATEALALEAAGLEADDRGRLWCDDEGMTWIPTIAAAGEAIGYPAPLRENLGRIRQTIAKKLAEETTEAPATISFRLEEAEDIPAPQSRRRQVRINGTPMLRVYAG